MEIWLNKVIHKSHTCEVATSLMDVLEFDRTWFNSLADFSSKFCDSGPRTNPWCDAKIQDCYRSVVCQLYSDIEYVRHSYFNWEVRNTERHINIALYDRDGNFCRVVQGFIIDV